MDDLSLHVLDIAENSLTAGATEISITITEDSVRDVLSIVITDNGRGMDSVLAEAACDPFVTTRTTRRVGLGLALFREAARAAAGSVTVRSAPNTGTTVTAVFGLNHIDRKPLGEMADTVTTLLAARPGLDLTYTHRRNDRTVSFSANEVREQLNGTTLSNPAVLSLVRSRLAQEEIRLAHNA
jgi:anti-sigma regulatory factor (Ser/Thr protein kinase)